MRVYVCMWCVWCVCVCVVCGVCVHGLLIHSMQDCVTSIEANVVIMIEQTK